MPKDQEQGSSKESSNPSKSDTSKTQTKNQVPGRLLRIQKVQDSYDQKGNVIKNKLED